MDNNYIILLHRLALKHKLPVLVIRRIVESQFEFIQTKTAELDFNDVKTKEEFEEIMSNFNIKYLFSLSANYNIFNQIKKQKEQKTNGE